MSTTEHLAPMSDAEIDNVDREFNARTLSALLGERLSSHTRTHLLKRACELVPSMAAELRALRAPLDVEGCATAAREAAERVNNALLFDDAETQEGDMDKVFAALDHVEHAARLQREAEGLRADVARLCDERGEAESRFAAAQADAGKTHADLATARTEIERLKVTADAWKALAQAHRRVDAARTSEEQDAACDAVVAAVDALRALGIDPEA